MRILLFFITCLVSSLNCAQPWQREENKIIQTAQRENLPIVCIVTQSDPWSQKLQEEVLNHPDFHLDAIVWKVASEDGFREKYRIEAAPVILLLDPRGKEFARLNYMPMDAADYVYEIHTLINDFEEICVALDQKEASFNEEKWIDLYQKAKALSFPNYKLVILEKGLKKEKGTFFHVEKYIAMLEKRKSRHPEMKKFKKEILERDPENRLGTHFKIAVAEFEKLASKQKGEERLGRPLKPLYQYIEKFQGKDPTNLWKAEMFVAEYLFEKHKVKEALEHARASYIASPDNVKPQIAGSISQ